MKTLQWLLACWYARRVAMKLSFSQRQEFFAELPPTAPDPRGGRVAYPEAWLLITIADVEHALARATKAEFAA